MREIFVPYLSTSHHKAKPFVVVEQENGCWVPKYHRANKGATAYRVLKRFGRRNTHVHRLMYQFYYGEPAPGKLILHHCDNPPCCNPEHLYAGDHADNTRDKVSRGRMNPVRGERCNFSKVTGEQVREIRRLRELGHTYPFIAKRFGLHSQHVYRLCKKAYWKHV